MGRTSLLISVVALVISTAAHADVSISNKPTQNMSCDGGVCTAMARNANLNDVDLMQMLSSSDVTVKTGGGAKNIQVRYGFAWSSSHQVTLDSGGFVEFREPVTVMNSGGLAIKTNRRQGGELLFSGKGSVDLWDLHSKFTINGVRYTLVNDIATLAAGIAANPSGAFALAKDYDAAADGIYQKPTIATKFTGSFEGLSHLIDHLTINGQMKFDVARSGLFAWIYRNGDIAGSVRDLNLRHAKVSSKARKVETGILDGENDGSIAH